MGTSTNYWKRLGGPKFRVCTENVFFGWCLAIKLAINDDYLGDRDGTSVPGPEPLADLWLLSWWFVFHFSGTFSYLLDLMIHTEYFFRGSEATHQWTMVGTYVHANFNPIPPPSWEISWGWITIKHQLLHDFSEFSEWFSNLGGFNITSTCSMNLHRPSRRPFGELPCRVWCGGWGLGGLWIAGWEWKDWAWLKFGEIFVLESYPE